MAKAFSVDSALLTQVLARHGDDTHALWQLGLRLLTGDNAPNSPVNGAAVIAAAADRGDAQAWRLMASFAAQGLAQEQSWGNACAAMERAVALGDPLARQQQRLLRALHLDNVQGIENWLVCNDAEVFQAAPRMLVFRHFLPSALCDYLIQEARPRLVRADVYDVATGVTKIDPMRTNRRAPHSVLDIDLVVQLIRARLARAAGVAVEMLESPEVLHYEVGQQYKLHVDYFHVGSPRLAEHVRIHGQRVKTALIYLNDDYVGGETAFPRLGVSFRGGAGDALLFEDVDAQGNGDLRTAHQGSAPTQGEKWLLSQWIRDKSKPFS
jgi:prolyl 4-hydroxylase